MKIKEHQRITVLDYENPQLDTNISCALGLYISTQLPRSDTYSSQYKVYNIIRTDF